MNILKNGAYTWWQIGILKLAMLCFGVAIGAYWSAAFLPYIGILIAIGIVLGIYLGLAWIKK